MDLITTFNAIHTQLSVIKRQLYSDYVLISRVATPETKHHTHNRLYFVQT